MAVGHRDSGEATVRLADVPSAVERPVGSWRRQPDNDRRDDRPRKLAAALAEADIDYVHLPALGNPKNNRGPSRTGDPESRQRFRALLHDEVALQALDHIVGLLEDGAVAVLCCERSDEDCYRHLVAEAVLKARPSVELVAI